MRQANDNVQLAQPKAGFAERQVDLAGAAAAAKGGFDQAKANYTTTVTSSLPAQMRASVHAIENAQAALDAQQKLYDSYLRPYEQHAGTRKDVDQASVTLTAAKKSAAGGAKTTRRFKVQRQIQGDKRRQRTGRSRAWATL
ncbi:MAG: hypothetical protein M3Y72_15675 [Acidobacteriota bacterium]|nr:hypothetical protein [Acidobacteriota bacterium]